MDRYTSPRPMTAGKITDIVRSQQGGEVLLKLEGDETISVDESFDAKYSPQIGGYYVLYGDGYKMYADAEHFEAHHQKL